MHAFCRKHRKADRDWSEWGPHNPRPAGLTDEMIRSQRALIRTLCERGTTCEW